MKKHWIGKVALGIVGIPALIALVGYVTMSLWNWLMPELFGLNTVTFWQALGLLILSKILFGGWKGGHHKGHRGGPWARRFRAKWENMSEEEREKYRRCRGRYTEPRTEEEGK